MEASADREGDSRSRSASPDAAAARRDQAARALSFLRRVPLLSSAPLSALEALASVAQHYVVGRGEVVLQQGAAADDGVFFVKKGDFQVVQELPVYAANADSEAQAAKEFVLPPLSPEAAAVQRARLQASEQRRTRRQQQSQAASSAASNASLHAGGADTFLTAAEAAQSRSSLLSGRSSGIGGSGSSHNDSMAAIHEHSTKGTHAADEDEEYTDLAAYDSANETKQQQRHLSARHGQQQQQQQLPRKFVLPPDASGSSRVGIDGDGGNPAGSGGGVIVGSRFLEVSTLGPYACFGEWAVLHRAPRSASVISRTSGGEVWAVTMFDFLRCCPRRLLADLRQMSTTAYRSIAELELELDDTQQWQAYKTHLLALARDKSIKNHRQQNIPVFESVPVGAFNIRLPELKQNELLDDSDVPVVPPPRRLRNKRTLLQQRQQQFVGLAEHPALRSFAAAAASAAASSIAASAAIAHRRSALGLEQSEHVDSTSGSGRGSVSSAAPGGGGIAASRREVTRHAAAAPAAKSLGGPTDRGSGASNRANSGRQRRSLLLQQQHPPSPPPVLGAATERSSVATAIGSAISHGRRQGNNVRAKLSYADGSLSAR